MHFSLISPRLVIQKNDFLGSGVPYWPIELATLASHIIKKKDEVKLYDLFGSNPKLLEDKGDHYLQGVDIKNYIKEIGESDCIIIYAISYMSHHEINNIIRIIKSTYPKKKIAILENSQSVTAYSVQRVCDSFFEHGADLVIVGEPYFNWDEIKNFLIEEKVNKPINVLTFKSSTECTRIIKKISKYPIPAWNLINLKNYWSLPYSHGPKTKKYLPVLTSRGCPYPCDFCVVPETNNRRWRGNLPEDVVNEIAYLKENYNVSDFQIEDLNPTVDHKRWEAICKILIKKNLNIKFYFVSGTKAETVHLDSIPLFAKAGCKYISISPESGSDKVMKKIGKNFNYEHGLKLIKLCLINNIKTQACFIIGHPSETENDFIQSNAYLAKLIRAGLDETAIFIVSPFAGSKIYKDNLIEIEDKELIISFSPEGRKNYKELSRRRRIMIFTFLRLKITRHFFIFLVQCYRALIGTPKTKIENLPRRIIYIYILVIFNKLKSVW